MKKILIITLLLAIISISAVSAAENATDVGEMPTDLNAVNEIDETPLEDAQKEDLNATISYNEYILNPYGGDRELYLSFNNVPEDYNRYVSVYVDDEFKFSMDSHGIEDAYFTNYNYGPHIIKASFPETAKYNPLNVTHTFEITKGYIYIPDTANIVTGSVSVHLQPEATGYLIVNVNGKQFKKVKVSESDGESNAYVSLSSLKAGSYEIEATYTGDSNNKKITKKKTVKIVNDYQIWTNYIDYCYYEDSFCPYNIYGNDRNFLEVILPEDVKKTPTASINNTFYPVKETMEGSFEVDLSTVLPGSHTVKVTYPGDDKYPEKSVYTDIFVTVSIKPIIKVYNESYVSLKLPYGEGNLSVWVNGTLYRTQKLEDGFANITLDGLACGVKYNITANYSGDEYDLKTYSMVKTLIPKITYTKSITYGKTATINVKMSSEKNGIVTCTVDGKNQVSAKIVNGSAKISLKGLDIAKDLRDKFNNKIVLKCEANGYTYKTSFYILVKPIQAKLTNTKDINMYYGDSKTYTVKLYDYYGKAKSGETLKITIGTKTFKVKTGKNGIAKFEIPTSIAPGTYKIKVEYNKYQHDWISIGDETADYTPVIKTSKLTIKQLLSLKSAAVKKSAKKLVLTATLKKGKTPIKNKQITFKFNGKTYKAKTNNKGVAKVIVPKTVLSKLKVGKTVTYQATYLKDTVKKTVKVKK